MAVAAFADPVNVPVNEPAPEKAGHVHGPGLVHEARSG